MSLYSYAAGDYLPLTLVKTLEAARISPLLEENSNMEVNFIFTQFAIISKISTGFSTPLHLRA
jgi:hypothetical protein